MEELIQNFMITTEGPQIPAGEAYFEAENPKGHLVLRGFQGWRGAVSPQDSRAVFLFAEYFGQTCTGALYDGYYGHSGLVGFCDGGM